MANALVDPQRTQTLIYNFSRAVQRVARGAVGNTIEVTITIKEAVVLMVAEITDAGKVRVTTKLVPPDDIQ